VSAEIGKKIKYLRKSKGLTQEDLSLKLNGDPSRSTLSNYEIGRRTPHLKDLQRICVALNVDLSYFGVENSDTALELLARAKEVFADERVSKETKDKLYMEFMKLYLDMKKDDEK